MNPEFLNDITNTKTNWNNLPLIEHIGMIRGYMLVCNQDYFSRTSRAWAREQLHDALNNFAFSDDKAVRL
jgi:hypothetical protein